MATQSEIQALIDEIVTNANYRANQLRPLLTSMLDFASAGQTQVFDGLVANNTTTSTTLILDYGVNIISTSTSTNYAAKLPQPVTGKRVIVVNKSTFPVSLFPSNVGGQINNYPIDFPAIIPPDGKAYDFICVENPLPGAWVWSPPATTQFDSGEMLVAHTNGVQTSVHGYSNATISSGSYSAGSNGGNLALTGNWTSELTPAYATKVKVYTNILSADLATSFIPDSIEVGLVRAYLSAPNVFNVDGQQFIQLLNGSVTFPDQGVSYSPIGTLNSPPEIGDTETMYTLFDYSPFLLIGTGGAFSSYYYTYKMIIPSTAATKTYKFRFILENY
jgi:hypothetical protein